jgi:flagellar biosynthetic protein FliR
MIPGLAPGLAPDLFSAFAPDRAPAFVLVTARVGGLMLTAPLWSMTVMPRTLRAAITVVITLALLPHVPPMHLPEEILALPLPIAMEGMVGIAIGLTGAVLIQALALAGEVIALQMGLSLGPALSPSPDVQVSGVAQLKTILGLFLYTSIGGHLMLLGSLADSLRILPPGSGFGFSAGIAPITAMFGTLFSCAVRVAAPAMVALLVTNVALAILSRAVPQLNAMMVAFPLTIGVGLIVVGAALPVISGVTQGWIVALPAASRGVLDAFVPAGGP